MYPHRRDLWSKKFFVCTPCDARVGCHANGKPLGRLADAELRTAKMRAHSAFDKLWKNGGMSRNDAYRWLAGKLGVKKVHIGEMDVDECELVIRLSHEHLGGSRSRKEGNVAYLEPPYGDEFVPQWFTDVVDNNECPFENPTCEGNAAKV